MNTPSAEKSNRFPRGFRLRHRLAFARVFRARRSASARELVVLAVRNQFDRTRLGIVVGRKVGNAVVRVRLRRVVREAFRVNRTALPVGYDLICVLRPAASKCVGLLGDHFIKLAARAIRQVELKEKTRQL